MRLKRSDNFSSTLTFTLLQTMKTIFVIYILCVAVGNIGIGSSVVDGASMSPAEVSTIATNVTQHLMGDEENGSGDTEAPALFEDQVTSNENNEILDNSVGDQNPVSQRDNNQKRKWVSQLFMEAQWQFESQPLPSEANASASCQRDYRTYLAHLQNQTLWAVRMLESSQWPTFNIFGGTLDHLGSFDECLLVKSQALDETHSIRGRYCIAEAIYDFATSAHGDIQVENSQPNHVFGALEYANEQDSVWKAIDLYEKNPVRMNRRSVRWALCMPSTCSALDLESVLQEKVGAIFKQHNLQAEVNVDPIHCTTMGEQLFPTQVSRHNPGMDTTNPIGYGYYITSTFFALLISLIIIASAYDCIPATSQSNSMKQKCVSREKHNSCPSVKAPKHAQINFNHKQNTISSIGHDGGRIINNGFPKNDSNTSSRVTKNCSKNSTGIEMLLSFSLIRNFRQLMKYEPSKDMIVLHFTKVFNILMVIYGHRYIFCYGYPVSNAEKLEKTYKMSSIELIHTNVVDSFFMVSGFLTFYFGLRPMQKGGVLYFCLSIIFRWIRMIPIFGLLMMFIVNIFPYMSEGPYWKKRIMREVENCGTSWWTSLLIVSNVIRSEKQCLVISWYISTDIQLTILGGLLLLIYCKHRGMGITACIITFLVSTAITFAVTYINHYHGLLRLYTSLLAEPRNSIEFTTLYVAPYNRAGPYLVGFIAAFICHQLKERKIQINNSKFWYLVAAIVIGEGSQYYGTVFYVYGRPYNRIENALYASINRSLYVLPWAVAVTLDINFGLGEFGRILSRRFLVPVGRLTYCTFLVNTLIQLYHAATQRQPMPTSTPALNLVWFATADIVYSYFFGFLLHLLAEAPLNNLSKMLQIHIVNCLKKSYDRNDNSTKEIKSSISEVECGIHSENISPALKPHTQVSAMVINDQHDQIEPPKHENKITYDIMSAERKPVLTNSINNGYHNQVFSLDNENEYSSNYNQRINKSDREVEGNIVSGVTTVSADQISQQENQYQIDCNNSKISSRL